MINILIYIFNSEIIFNLRPQLVDLNTRIKNVTDINTVFRAKAATKVIAIRDLVARIKVIMSDLAPKLVEKQQNIDELTIFV